MSENRLRCFIVDDEPLALKLIESYVLKTPFLELKGKFSNAFDVFKELENQEIDLIFLDIQMPDLNGLELSKMLPKSIRVIFTTAYDKFALDGFKVEALDYLLKPFSYDDFLNSATRAKEWFSIYNSSKNGKTNLSSEQQSNDKKYLFVKSEYKQIKINLDDILYFEGLKSYVKIWLKGESKAILSLMSLKSIEEELSSDKFMRIHRSFIIALDKIDEIERSQVIINKQRITIADQYKEEFQNWLNKYNIN